MPGVQVPVAAGTRRVEPWQLLGGGVVQVRPAHRFWLRQVWLAGSQPLAQALSVPAYTHTPVVAEQVPVCDQVWSVSGLAQVSGGGVTHVTPAHLSAQAPLTQAEEQAVSTGS